MKFLTAIILMALLTANCAGGRRSTNSEGTHAADGSTPGFAMTNADLQKVWDAYPEAKVSHPLNDDYDVRILFFTSTYGQRKRVFLWRTPDGKFFMTNGSVTQLTVPSDGDPSLVEKVNTKLPKGTARLIYDEEDTYHVRKVVDMARRGLLGQEEAKVRVDHEQRETFERGLLEREYQWLQSRAPGPLTRKRLADEARASEEAAVERAHQQREIEDHKFFASRLGMVYNPQTRDLDMKKTTPIPYRFMPNGMPY